MACLRRLESTTEEDSLSDSSERWTEGVHHLALQVPGTKSFDAPHKRLAQRDDVAIEFAPQPLGGGPTRHMLCAIPGGIRVEFLAPTQG